MIKTSYSQTLSITDEQRDSIYAKIQRGKINAERVGILNLALKSCDSVKGVLVTVISIQEKQKDSLYVALDKDKEIISNLEENVKLEVKRGRRRGFWGFVKGTGVGVLAVLLANLFL